MPLRDRDWPLPPLLLLLTFVTGVVDAVSYLALGHVFVANMTGNIVFIGFALAGAPGFSLAASAAALAAFMVGAAVGGRLAVVMAHERIRLFLTATIVQLVLVGIACVVSAVDRTSAAAGQYPVIGLLGIAMGAQNAAIPKLNVPDIATTVLTRTTAALIGEASWLGGPGARPARRAVSILVMLAGALVGALLVVRVTPTAALAVATLLLAVAAAGVPVLRSSAFRPSSA